MGIGLANYLTLAAIVFTIGVAGIILNHKNIIIILMSVELILLAVNINLIAFSTYSGDLTGQAFALFVLRSPRRSRRSVLRSWSPITAIAAQSRLRTSIR